MSTPLSTPHQAYYQAENSYLEHKVLSASPLELVCLLYEGAIEGTVDARRQMDSGDILARGRSVARVQAIIVELLSSLNTQVDADLARRLTLLYDYILRKLEEGHRDQNGGALLEAEQLLRNLFEGWQQLVHQTRTEATSSVGPAPTPDGQNEAALQALNQLA